MDFREEFYQNKLRHLGEEVFLLTKQLLIVQDFLQAECGSRFKTFCENRRNASSSGSMSMSLSHQGESLLSSRQVPPHLTINDKARIQPNSDPTVVNVVNKEVGRGVIKIVETQDPLFQQGQKVTITKIPGTSDQHAIKDSGNFQNHAKELGVEHQTENAGEDEDEIQFIKLEEEEFEYSEEPEGEDSNSQGIVFEMEGEGVEDSNSNAASTSGGERKRPKITQYGGIPWESYHMATTEGKIMCTYNSCNKPFRDIHKFKRHFLSHTGLTPFKCTVCPAAYTRNDQLQRHIMNH